MELNKFVQNAKDQRVDSETIRRVLVRRGWSEEDIDDALLGELDVPVARGTHLTQAAEKHSTSPLFSALHHVLLWFFVVAASFAIVSAISSLFYEYVSEEALASFIAVSAITFVPYVVVFALYLKARRNSPALAPGRVWSIITICLGSIGLMAAAITAVVSLIVGSEQAVIVSAFCLMLVYSCVVVTYSAAAFLPGIKPTLRATLLLAPLGLITLLLVGIFVPSLLQLGPAKSDAELQKDLVTTVTSIRESARSANALPDDATPLLANPAITYEKRSDRTYQLCAPFGLKHRESKTNERSPISDTYVSEYDFSGSANDNCFIIETDSVQTDQARNERQF